MKTIVFTSVAISILSSHVLAADLTYYTGSKNSHVNSVQISRSGSFTLSRSGKGKYEYVLNVSVAVRPHFQISLYGIEHGTCNIFEISSTSGQILCFDEGGGLADRGFSILSIQGDAGSSADLQSIAYARLPQSGIGGLSGNIFGDTIRISPDITLGPGNYFVTISPGSLQEAILLITPHVDSATSGAVYCVTNWFQNDKIGIKCAGRNAANLGANVLLLRTGVQDMRFRLITWNDRTFKPVGNDKRSWPRGGAVARSNGGKFDVELGETAEADGHVQVFPHSVSGTAGCSIGGWSNKNVQILCAHPPQVAGGFAVVGFPPPSSGSQVIKEECGDFVPTMTTTTSVWPSSFLYWNRTKVYGPDSDAATVSILQTFLRDYKLNRACSFISDSRSSVDAEHQTRFWYYLFSGKPLPAPSGMKCLPISRMRDEQSPLEWRIHIDSQKVFTFGSPAARDKAKAEIAKYNFKNVCPVEFTPLMLLFG